MRAARAVASMPPARMKGVPEAHSSGCSRLSICSVSLLGPRFLPCEVGRVASWRSCSALRACPCPRLLRRRLGHGRARRLGVIYHLLFARDFACGARVDRADSLDDGGECRAGRHSLVAQRLVLIERRAAAVEEADDTVGAGKSLRRLNVEQAEHESYSSERPGAVP